MAPTGKVIEGANGPVEMYRIEPHECPKCGKTTNEFAGEYGGRKAAESMVRVASRGDYKCFHCTYNEAREMAKQHFRPR